MYEKQIQKHFTTDMGLLSYSFLICHYGSTFNKGFNSHKYYITHVLTTDIVLCCFACYYYYLAISTRALIGQFSGPYSAVRPAKI